MTSVSFLNSHLREDLDLSEEVELTPFEIEFEDSSHQIVILHSSNGLHQVAKCVNQDAIERSAFWRGMRLLFQFDFLTQVRQFQHLYPWMAKHSVLAVPYWVRHVEHSDRVVSVSDWLPGQTADVANLTADWVETLARQVAALHETTADKAGMMACSASKMALEEVEQTSQQDLIANPKVANGIDDWGAHLAQVLPTWLSQATPESEADWQDVIAQARDALNAEIFAVVMPDLRWDQFLELEEELVALTDLDALVFAPRRLEWVLLEYLIPAEQMALFVATYKQKLPIPPLEPVRTLYRAILFAMNVLGEKDYQAWMSHPTYLP